MSKITIAIISYNSSEDLASCIKAAQTAASTANLGTDIVVVDNNSHDNSVVISKKHGIQVIANKTNRGFAAAVNQGLQYGLDHNSDYYLILNPDAKLYKDCLKEMVSSLDKDPKIGAVGPSMYSTAGKVATDGYYLKAPSWISVSLFSTFLRPFFIKRAFFVRTFYQETNLASDRAVAQIPGACLLTSKNALEKIGLWDEDFAIWFEDVEWCYRARKKGYTMLFCKNAKVIHEGGVSFEKWQSLNKAVTFYVSMKTFFNKHKPVSGLIVRFAIVSNSLFLYIKSRDRSNLKFLKRFLKQKRGYLPE